MDRSVGDEEEKKSKLNEEKGKRKGKEGKGRN